MLRLTGLLILDKKMALWSSTTTPFFCGAISRQNSTSKLYSEKHVFKNGSNEDRSSGSRSNKDPSPSLSF
jgi:hypothetical protein